jgi:hypothetical protein
MSSETANEPEAYTIAELAKALRCSESFVYLELSRNNLAAVKLGARTIILASEKRRYVAALPALISRAAPPKRSRAAGGRM